MINAEFDLYKREWLSLVFKGRNQQYGAYELRSHYGNVMTRAMAITFFSVAALAGTITVISHNRPVETKPDINKIVAEVPIPPKVFEAKLKEIQKPKQTSPPAKANPVSTQSINYVVTTDDKVIKDPEPIKDNVAIGPVDKVVPGSGPGDVPVIEESGVKGGTGTEVDNSTHDFGEGLEVMPEPIGGDKAWAKFLQKNLRFPAVAQEQGVSGKSFVSFIIEKDGKLSNISVIRKGGYGFDEEATRVLKMAAAWKPGMQNGQAVRVRYIIPINFQLAEQ